MKGRRFDPPANKWPTRPTTDISKEGLYNILQSQMDLEGKSFLDLFGGTGNHCYEMISRGVEQCTYVDKHGPAVFFVKKQVKEWKIDDQMTIWKSDIRKFLSKNNHRYDLIFAGPPYGLEWLDEIPNMVFASDALEDEGLFILEHNPHHAFEEHERFVRSRKYGQTIFSFFE